MEVRVLSSALFVWGWCNAILLDRKEPSFPATVNQAEIDADASSSIFWSLINVWPILVSHTNFSGSRLAQRMANVGQTKGSSAPLSTIILQLDRTVASRIWQSKTCPVL